LILKDRLLAALPDWNNSGNGVDKCAGCGGSEKKNRNLLVYCFFCFIIGG
jgi:hypothetical protein